MCNEGGILMILAKPAIRRSKFYLLVVVVFLANVWNVIISLPLTGAIGRFPVMDFIVECILALLGYVAVRVVILNFVSLRGRDF